MIDWIAARGWRRTLVALIALIPFFIALAAIAKHFNFTERERWMATFLLMTYTWPFVLYFRFLWRVKSMPRKERGLKGEDNA